MRARPQDRSVLSTRESASAPRELFFLRPPGLLACASRRVCFPVALIPPALLPCVLRRRAAAYLEEPPAKRVETNGVGWQCRRDGPPPYDGRTSRLSSSITPVFDFNTFPHAPTAHAYACASDAETMLDGKAARPSAQDGCLSLTKTGTPAGSSQTSVGGGTRQRLGR